jgi:hypothetical protein
VFIWQHGKAQAQNGYNDDLVMALGIGLFTRDTAMKFYEQGMDLNRAMVSMQHKVLPEQDITIQALQCQEDTKTHT